MQLISSLVTGVYDLKEIVAGNSESFNFRVEIHQKYGTSKYFPKIYRLETYRIPPSFGQAGEATKLEAFDEVIHVLDHLVDTASCSAETERECLEKVEQQIKRQFPTTQ